jgi:hypothetical protein
MFFGDGLRRFFSLCRRGVWLIVLALLFGGMVYFYYVYPHRSIGPKQPIYFSHRVHAGVKEISCRFCHPFVDRSQNAGIPPVEQCFFCHRTIISQHPQIVKERWHLDTKTPVPWVRVFYVPDHVKFNHQPHIRSKVDCVECHGDVKKFDRLVPVDFKMGFCVDCHRQRKAQLDCWLACHH